jgi:hypothetical protein
MKTILNIRHVLTGCALCLTIETSDLCVARAGPQATS